MITLREKQSIFANLVANLIIQAQKFGYELTLGEVWRSPEEAARLATLGKGIKDSLHIDRLAIDLNLFKNGVYQMETKDYELLGEWWEGQSTDTFTLAWGGRFNDGNHFSMEHDGKK
jgi:hypothetical protein